MADKFNTLTMQQIISALPLHHFPASVKRNKAKLLQHLEGLSTEEEMILHGLVAKNSSGQTRKRKRMNEAYYIQKLAKHTEEYFDGHAGVNTAECYYIPTTEELKSCICDFRNATSNTALRLKICGVCARELLENKDGLEMIPLDELPNFGRLRPSEPHPSQKLYNGCLLAPSGVTETEEKVLVNVCRTCKKGLQGDKDIPPTLSLANNLWIGDIPWQLQILTLPEQLLISLVYPRVFVMKLFPKRRQRHVDPNTLQSGMRGNVSTYELNIDAVANMLQGKLMPRPPNILASLIAITFIGHGPLPRNWLKRTFSVRRYVVSEALYWLKTNNSKYYGDIQIDSAQLVNLPVDGIPEELMNIIRHEPNSETMADEDTGYVPEVEGMLGLFLHK